MNITSPKNTNSLGIDLSLKGIYEMAETEYKIMMLRKLSEMQENTNKLYTETRKPVKDMNEKFNKERLRNFGTKFQSMK